MNLEEASQHVLSGNAILFCGAGFSREAKNLKGEAFKTGRELSAMLGEQLGLTETYELHDISDAYLSRKGAPTLISELSAQFRCSEVCSYHQAIARLPWRCIYTTNFDNVLETSNPRLKPVTLSDKIENVQSNTLSVHLNGYVDRLNASTIESELRLTGSSYAAGPISSSEWMARFRQDLAYSKAVIFIGYSISDLDIRRVLFDSTSLRNRAIFFVGENPDPLLESRIRNFGECFKQSAATFSDSIKKLAEEFEVPNPPSVPWRGVREVTYVEAVENLKPSDREVFDLLLLGKVNEGLVRVSQINNFDYIVPRSQVSPEVDHLVVGNRALIATAELGNGKTIFLRQMEYSLLGTGARVFRLEDVSPDVYADLDILLACESVCYLTIDGYSDHLSVIGYLSSRGFGNIRLILTERSIIDDVAGDDLLDLLKSQEVRQISLDGLDAEELSRFEGILSAYGMWGELASLSLDRKVSHLKIVCKSQVHGILGTVLNSPQIRERFKLVLDRVRSEGAYYEVVIGMLTIACIGRTVAPHHLQVVCGEGIFEHEFRNNRDIREIFDLGASGFGIRSSVTASFILKSSASVSTVVNVMVAMATRLDSVGWVNDSLRKLFIDLIRFRSIQIILPGEDSREPVINFYENVKNLKGCKTNYLFWLQYAIACTSLGEYLRAESYYATAYSYAAKSNKDTTQIDNHYARQILESVTVSRDATRAMEVFRKARGILVKQMQVENMYYPYRVAKHFFAFYLQFKDVLSAEDLSEVDDSARAVLILIEKLEPSLRKHFHVRNCEIELRKLNDLFSQTFDGQK